MRLRWKRTTGSTWGDAAFASLGLAALSGVALAVPYDVRAAYDSVALLLLGNPAGAFLRSIHYWSSQAFLVLTLVHTWDHLRRATERHLPQGLWARVVLSLPLALFVALSGFILRGDPEGMQALRIASTATEQVPLIGPLLAAALFGGRTPNLPLLYVHHVATSTVLTWLFVAEHARMVWPKRWTLIAATAAIVAVSAVVSPGLHDSLDPLVKGPWYFIGLQEALYWVSRPLVVVGAGLVLLAALVALPRLPVPAAHLTKRLLAGVAALYVAGTVTAAFFRAENWIPATPSRAFSPGLVVALPGPGASLSDLQSKPVPVVLGRREGCLFCHSGVRGLSASHDARAVGCASCHGGNPFSLDARVAHRGMRVVPGNLADAERSCGTVACHPGIPARVARSVMTTMSGVVAVDRKVFGEKTAEVVNVADLGHGAADSHLRQLCASCHLGAGKAIPGPAAEESRGGGCTACHVTYATGASEELARYRTRRGVVPGALPPPVHANVSVAVDDSHCFGCHSRSGRISTTYLGWHELEEGAVPPPDRRLRTLTDGRRFAFVQADVHAGRGMQCIDCHTAREVMGDGAAHGRKIEQIRVACEDCHFRGVARRVSRDRLDSESRKLVSLRRTQPDAEWRLAAMAGDPLVNTVVEPTGRPRLRLKATSEERELRPPAAVCIEGAGHARLSCISCHSAWAPRCSGCHTSFDPATRSFDHLAGREVPGAWTETPGDFRAAPPTLGVRAVGRVARVETFVPGMILTLDRNREAGRPPDHVARRLYARAFSHAVSKAGRSCRSCHTDPEALGYGRGLLTYTADSRGGTWSFAPAMKRSSFDGLPSDAWIGFLADPPPPRDGVGPSTTPGARPLNREEQRRVLTVGACLTCHEPESAVMRDSVRDFGAVLRRVSGKCALPRW